MIATRFDTERLALLPLRVEYAEEMAKVLASPDLYTFTGGEPPTADVLTERYGRQLSGPGRAEEYWLNWVISSLEDDALVGYLQATVTPDAAEIAWVLGVDWQGRGYAKEAATGLVDWLRAQGAGRIVAHVHPDHTASAAVATAVGLHRTDQLDNGEHLWES
ncbi:RimJ/RimL family protein N-acetyltransferase [Kribbella sp. VKM Ac-2527]|uniref:RimJ/RimL family protein N-acetyltransferase n=1 Tax=Kribbella caucasensis TaxID=2512215 RepID=A0A4R6KC65_9ACTN|nr:GNAT family N-acetyltransferase [Kribbella sp. VKM Ac-2527]TDO47169.1 RimJ/RimL family protein N-acetyltransferase [Kribbella sp. VKM Ac-2527]